MGCGVNFTSGQKRGLGQAKDLQESVFQILFYIIYIQYLMAVLMSKKPGHPL